VRRVIVAFVGQVGKLYVCLCPGIKNNFVGKIEGLFNEMELLWSEYAWGGELFKTWKCKGGISGGFIAWSTTQGFSDFENFAMHE